MKIRCKDLEIPKMHLKTQAITIHIGTRETKARNIKYYIFRFRELSLAERLKIYCIQVRPTSLGKFYQYDKGLFKGRRILAFMCKLSYIHRILHILQWFLLHIWMFLLWAYWILHPWHNFRFSGFQFNLSTHYDCT